MPSASELRPSTLRHDHGVEAPPALRALLRRRSVKELVAPGPTDAELLLLLEAATTVPDHGGLRPWRLGVVDGGARAAFGDALVDAVRQGRPDLDDETAERVRSKAFAAPTLIAVAAHVDMSSRVPRWEQVASATCCAYAIILAADLLGLGAIWKSSRFLRGPAIFELLDLGDDDEVLGWVNLGQVASPPTPRRPVDLHGVTRWVAAPTSS